MLTRSLLQFGDSVARSHRRTTQNADGRAVSCSSGGTTPSQSVDRVFIEGRLVAGSDGQASACDREDEEGREGGLRPSYTGCS